MRKDCVAPKFCFEKWLLSFSPQPIFFRLFHFDDFPKLGMECLAYAWFQYFSPFLISQALNSWCFEPFTHLGLSNLFYELLTWGNHFPWSFIFYEIFNFHTFKKFVRFVGLRINAPWSCGHVKMYFKKPIKQLQTEWSGLSSSLRTSSHLKYWDKREFHFCHNVIF